MGNKKDNCLIRICCTMPGIRIKVGVLLYMLLASSVLLGREVILINNQTTRIEAFDSRISVLKDTTGLLSLEEVRKMNFDSLSIIIANNRDQNTAYWVKFDLVVEEDITVNKVFEILDFKIDFFELYLPDTSGGYIVHQGGDIHPFGSREYIHKNFVFDMPHYPKGKYLGFIRIKATEVVGFNLAVSNMDSFVEYSTREYFILSIFYGVIIAMGLLSIFLYIYLYEISYLLYSLYILSMGLYFLTRDGLGFQYLWPDYPLLNDYCKPVTVFMVVVFHVLFVRYYWDIRQYSRTFDNLLYGLLVFFPLLAYGADHFLGILPDPLIAVSIVFIPLMIFSIRLALKGDIEARFFVIAYLVQFAGFIVFIFAYLDWIGKGHFVFYSINIASAIEIIVFSLALAGKVKHLIREKEEIKDQANKVLEQKVEERTRELQERNHQLDIFLYKASHDIKGPLKSMISLNKLALNDVKDQKAREYFEYMLSTSARLDSMVSELLRMGKVKDLEVQYSEVQLSQSIEEILNSLRHLPGFDKMSVEVNIPPGYRITTDKVLIHSILQNLIENAIKYKDTGKAAPYLKIDLAEKGDKILLSFEDNGLGIPDDRKERIFEMFYTANNHASGTGLGLYLTKLTIERLGGELDFTTAEGKGTTFFVTFSKETL